MNKQLLTATALVAVGLLGASGAAVAQKKMKASKPTISVGGYYAAGVRFTDNADSVGGRNTGGFSSFTDSEIHFKIKGMLDNGIKIGGGWELEGDHNENNVTDEARVWFRGAFGEVRLGADDGAAQLMVLGYQGSWATQNGLNLNFDVNELIPQPAGYNLRITGARLDLSDTDNEKITYITPRFGGFQVGGSYARDVGGGLDYDSAKDQSLGKGKAEDWISVAANFDKKFGSFRLGVAAGYVQEKSSSKGNGRNPTEWGGGVLVESGPVRVSAGFKTVDDYFSANDVTSHEGEHFDVGVRYTMGAHKIGLAYYTSSTDAAVATAGEDEVAVLWATHSMTLAPGVSWKNTIGWADWDGEGTSATADNDGWGAATHIALSF